MYCKDCFWWKERHCTNVNKISEEPCWDIDQLSYSNREDGGFQTGPLFGCVHFQAASNNKEGGYGMSSVEETKKHIRSVSKKLEIISRNLLYRGLRHDESKLEEPEVSIFDIYTEKLKNTTYGSDEYKKYLSEMKPALDHHYENNRHHPEHFKNGINDMNLVDIMEMFCDWLAATERHADGDVYKSITLNKLRFGFSSELKKLFVNTARDIFHMARGEKP